MRVARNVHFGLTMFLSCDKCDIDAEHDTIYVSGPSPDDFNEEGYQMLVDRGWNYEPSSKYWTINV